MAKSRLRRYLSIAWDRDAARRLEQDAEASLERAGRHSSKALEGELQKGGQKGARALTTALQREYKYRMAKARQQMAEGAIDEKAFRKEGEEAAKAFNAGLTGGIKKLQASAGGLTGAQHAGLAGRFKRTDGFGGRGLAMGALLSRAAGPLAAVFGGAALVREAGDAIEAADRFDSALRKLEGSANITGVSLETLQGFVERLQAEMNLSEPIAVDLTASMAKLASRAGDISVAGDAMIAWLDLAAANGLDTQTALDALNTTIIGQDEGLNKLGLANPQQIYQKWGAGADEASKATAILSEVQDAAARVAGAHADRMESAAGQAEIARNRIDELSASVGAALTPLREWILEIKVGAYSALSGLIEWLQKTNEEFKKNREARRDFWNDRAALQEDALQNEVAGPGGNAPSRTGNRPPPPDPAAAAAAARAAAERGAAEKRAAAERERRQKEEIKRIKEMWDHFGEWLHATHGVPLGLGGDTGTTAEMRAARQRRRAALEDLRNRGGATSADAGDGAPGVIEPRILTEFQEQVKEVMGNAESIGSEAAYQMASAWQDAFEMMMEEGATLGNFMEALGRGLAGSILAGIAQVAQVKSAEMFVRAIEAGATALLNKDPAAAASIPKWLAAGTGYAALAGMAGAGRGAVTGGAGGIPTSTRDAGLGTAERAGRIGPEVHIYVDGIDPSNPRHQELTYAANQWGAERAGPNGRVIFHPRGGAR